MELFKKTISFEEMASFVKGLFSAGLKQFWEDYNSFVEERSVLEDALASERCARKDTDERCKSLYDSLEKEKHSSEELKAKVCLLEISLATAESQASSLMKAIEKKEASLRRLSKMCFGKKGEKLKQLLGKKDYDYLRSLLCAGLDKGSAATVGEDLGIIIDTMEPGNGTGTQPDQDKSAGDPNMDRPTQAEAGAGEKEQQTSEDENGQTKATGQDGIKEDGQDGNQEDGKNGKTPFEEMKGNGTNTFLLILKYTRQWNIFRVSIIQNTTFHLRSGKVTDASAAYARTGS